MSVSALTNSFCNYVPVTSSQYETSTTDSISNAQNETNVKAIDEKSTQTQATSSTYKENNENTSNNNSNKNTSSYLTGEEILSSRPEKNSDSTKQLSEEEQKQVEELKARDREVKNHEQAHIAAGGSYVKGGASYDYQTGPDGKQYAVGGSVNIDTSPVEGDPEATIAKAQIVIKAALAPAEPSGQDQKVASAARQMMSEARKELASQKNNEINENDDNNQSITGRVNNSDTNTESSDVTIKTNNSTYSANNTELSEESAGKENNADNTSNTAAATYEPVQNTRESNISSVQQKKNQNLTALSYNIGSLISLTA